MRRSDFLLALASSRLVLMIIEVALLLGFGVLVFHMRVRARCWPFCSSARSARFPSAASDCSPPAARKRSKASAA